ncbi:MAG: hypothetical protein ACREBH_01210 [Candidatus Micrarchaeaceae archaeon]
MATKDREIGNIIHVLLEKDSLAVLRKDDLNADCVHGDLSPIVKNAYSIYGTAPKTIKEWIDDIRKDEYKRVKDMLRFSLEDKDSNTITLKKLSMVAAVELITSSPVYSDAMREYIDQAELEESEAYAFSSWFNKNISPSADNEIKIAEKYSYSDSSKEIMIKQIYEMDDAVHAVGTKRKVLLAMGKTELEVSDIIKKESKRLLNSTRAKVFDSKTEKYEDYLALVRISQSETKIDCTMDN